MIIIYNIISIAIFTIDIIIDKSISLYILLPQLNIYKYRYNKMELLYETLKAALGIISLQH